MIHNHSIGEGPARVRKGAITATWRTARAYVMRDAGRPEPRKAARQHRMAAAGFDRCAIFLREDGDEAGALRAELEAQRLRKLADDTEAAEQNKLSSLTPHVFPAQ